MFVFVKVEFSPCIQILLNVSVIAQTRPSLASGAEESGAKVLPTDDNDGPVPKTSVCDTLGLDWNKFCDGV